MDGVFATSKPKFVSCEKGYSFFFDLLKSRWRHNQPLHRLCSLARKMGVQSFTQENLEITGDIRDEVNAVAVCPDFNGKLITAKATRLTFFRSCPGNWRELGDQDLLGYAVVMELFEDGKRIKQGNPAYVLESVVRPPTVFLEPEGRNESVSNYYTHCANTFKTCVGTASDKKPFSIQGSFFCQQNALTHVCAHAALRMTINSSPKVHKKNKLTNKRINKILGIDLSNASQISALRQGGLGQSQIQAVVKALGLKAISANFPNPGADYSEYVYPLIESRMPVILGIGVPRDGETSGHVVSVLGHTVNSDRWEPQARSGYVSFPKWKCSYQ